MITRTRRARPTTPSTARHPADTPQRATLPTPWVTGDEVYGNDPDLRIECEIQQIGNVLAIGRDRRVPTAAGPIRADHGRPVIETTERTR
jgi:hypothetical protein